MPNVEIYTRPFCPYCARALHLLNARGIEFQQIDVGSDPASDEVMRRRSGRTSVPQIFINDHHVGGSDELAAAHASGLLSHLLTKVA